MNIVWLPAELKYMVGKLEHSRRPGKRLRN